jgi:CRP-like cAMP-binding protein
LLSGLYDGAHATLAPMLHIVDLAARQPLHERGQPFCCVHFLTTAIISATLPLQVGLSTQGASVGSEGFSGVEMLAGADSPINHFVCQIPGKAVHIAAQDFRTALDTVPGLRRLAFCYLQCCMAQMAQSAACNSQHVVEARFARWMLITHDRVEGDDFRLTQAFLSQMLGVHRPSVSLIANQFQLAGLISYSQGNIHIVNRHGLEEVCCECYAQVRDRFERLMGLGRG